MLRRPWVQYNQAVQQIFIVISSILSLKQKWSFFLLDVFAGLFSVLAVTVWTIQEVSCPLNILLINLVLVLIIIRPKLQLLRM